MYESFVKNFAKKVSSEQNLEEFFILTHCAHRREYYLKTNSPAALKFIYPKMNSLKKRIIYYGLRFNLIQPFLKKINLAPDLGDVIFCGNQLKIFNFEKKVVFSSNLGSEDSKKFIESKKSQIELEKIGFAPKIFKIDQKNIYSEEQLLDVFVGDDYAPFFKILKFYKPRKVKTEQIQTEILEILTENNLLEEIFKKAIKTCSVVDYFLFSRVHGDFCKEQCLKKENGELVFIDWNLKYSVITYDLVNYFRDENNLAKNDKVLKIIENYPQHVKDNFYYYLILTELLLLCKHPKRLDIAKRRISALLVKTI